MASWLREQGNYREEESVKERGPAAFHLQRLSARLTTDGPKFRDYPAKGDSFFHVRLLCCQLIMAGNGELNEDEMV